MTDFDIETALYIADEMESVSGESAAGKRNRDAADALRAAVAKVQDLQNLANDKTARVAELEDAIRPMVDDYDRWRGQEGQGPGFHGERPQGPARSVRWRI